MWSDTTRAIVMLIVVVAFYTADFLLTRRYDRLRADRSTGRSWSYTVFALIAGLLVIAQPVILPQVGLRMNAWWMGIVQAAGVGFAILALLLNWWARTHLQHYYTEGAEYQAGHRVISTGPYAYVRHPVFVSLFLLVTGLLLINPAVTTLLIAVYTFADFTQAARRDEQLLAEKLPEYRRYMEQTPRFFPRLRARTPRRNG